MCTRDLCFSLLLSAIVVDMITESVRNGLTRERMEGLREKFWKWKKYSIARG